MLNIILGTGAGLAILAYRLSANHRRKKKIEELSLGRDFNCLNYSRSIPVFIALATLLPIGFMIYTVKSEEEILIAVSITFVFLFVSEILNALQVFKFYYNDTCCIINERLVKYKSIKAVYKRKLNPFRPYMVLTFNKEQLNLAKAPTKILLEKSGQSIIE